MEYGFLQQQVAVYAEQLYREHTSPGLLYHDLQHINGVVDAATKMAAYYQLNDHDVFVVTAAAWMHDTGMLQYGHQNHEQRSAELAGQFLATLGVDEETCTSVKECILATTMPQRPQGLLQKIVCDADMFHLASGDWQTRQNLLRKEVELFKSCIFSKSEWHNMNIKFLQQHQYHTSYAQNLLEPVKKRRILNLCRSTGGKNQQAASSI